MATDLTNINISDSYKGLIHANGASLPAPSIQQPLYDGSGQKSSISLGVAGVGASVSGPLSISGQLSAGVFTYPASPATNGYVLAQINSNTIALTGILDILQSASSSYVADGTYNNVQNITVKNGLITSVTTTTAVRTFFCDLETFNATALSAAAGVSLSNTNRGVYPYGSSNVTNTISPWTVKPILIRDNYLNKVWGLAANNSDILPMYGTPNNNDVAIVVFSDTIRLPIVGTTNTALGNSGNYMASTSLLFAIKYVWSDSTAKWVWQRYLANGGSVALGTYGYDTGTYYTNYIRKAFQVNSEFSVGTDGQNYGIVAVYNDNTLSTTYTKATVN